MKKDIIIATALTMLLFMCIIVIMLDIHKTFNMMSNIYKQEHKVFVPDTMPKELSPDTLTHIKTIKENEYF